MTTEGHVDSFKQEAFTAVCGNASTLETHPTFLDIFSFPKEETEPVGEYF